MRIYSPHNRSGRGTLRLLHASAGLVERIINPIIGQTQLVITKGENASFCRFPATLGINELRFTVPVFTKRVVMFSVEQYANEIRSSGITLSFVNANSTFHHGSLRLESRFEENGNEISGTFQAHLKNMLLGVTIGLVMDNQQISYDRVEVKLDFELDVVGVPDILLDPIFGYTDKMRQQIEQDLAGRLSQDEIKSRISKAVTAKICTLLPVGSNLYSVKISRDAVFVKYWQ